MSSVSDNIRSLLARIPSHIRLIAVSKKKPAADIMEAYQAGQICFGENYVQELTDKCEQLPKDIEWHFIGHLQSNKVKYIAPIVSWIHAVESEKLLAEIDKQAAKNGRMINCLLQVHISTEESKFGFDLNEILTFCTDNDLSKYTNVNICGLMGMASFTENMEIVRKEFHQLKSCFETLKSGPFKNSTLFTEISMGMSGDWEIAIEEGSTMIRIGSAIFGAR